MNTEQFPMALEHFSLKNFPTIFSTLFRIYWENIICGPGFNVNVGSAINHGYEHRTVLHGIAGLQSEKVQQSLATSSVSTGKTNLGHRPSTSSPERPD
jgi:hypothetical protein